MNPSHASAHSRAQARGLLWMALLVAAAVLLRAWRHHLLGAAWWRLW
jgi:hypothetical protein